MKPNVWKAGRKQKEACMNFQIFPKYFDERQFVVKMSKNVFHYWDNALIELISLLRMLIMI